MKKCLYLFAVLWICQTLPAQNNGGVRLAQTIHLPSLHGKFDHFTFDLKRGRAFLAAEDQRVVAVIDLNTEKLITTIPGFGRPHGVFYDANTDTLMVTDGKDGACRVVDGKSLKIIASIKLNSDADSVGFDSKTKYLYVDNAGPDPSPAFSLLSIIDTGSNKHLSDIKIPGTRIEAMAMEQAGDRLFLNVTSDNKVAVISRAGGKVLATWPVPGAVENVAIALDEGHHRLFVACRKPGKIIVFDTESGSPVATLGGVADADDMSYDSSRQRIYLSGKEGYLLVIAQKSADQYEPIAKIATGEGAKTSYYVPQLNRVFVAVPAGAHPARILVFDVGE